MATIPLHLDRQLQMQKRQLWMGQKMRPTDQISLQKRWKYSTNNNYSRSCSSSNSILLHCSFTLQPNVAWIFEVLVVYCLAFLFLNIDIALAILQFEIDVLATLLSVRSTGRHNFLSLSFSVCACVCAWAVVFFPSFPVHWFYSFSVLSSIFTLWFELLLVSF